MILLFAQHKLYVILFTNAIHTKHFVNTAKFNRKNQFCKLGVFEFGLSPLQPLMVDWGPV